MLNLDSDSLHGIFKAKTDGKKDIVPEAWDGKYPYQVEVKLDGKLKTVKGAKKFLSKIGINRNNALNEEATKLLLYYLQKPSEFDWGSLDVENSKTRSNLWSSNALQNNFFQTSFRKYLEKRLDEDRQAGEWENKISAREIN